MKNDDHNHVDLAEASPGDREKMKLAFRLLSTLPPEQRGLVLSRFCFCPHCYEYTPPGSYCQCHNDE